jgi:GntR family transcriptional regulator
MFFSEEEIADQMDISRPTANKAIRNLIKKGYLTRSRCKRSIVSRINNVPVLFLQELGSFKEMLKNQNGENSYKTSLLGRRIKKANNKISKHLDIEMGEDVIFLRRIRHINEEPLVIVDSYLPYDDYYELLEIKESEFKKELYFLMKKLFGVSIHRSDREITATEMAPEDALLLNTEILEPCLRLTAVSYDTDEKPFEYFDSRFKGKNCVLKTSLSKL